MAEEEEITFVTNTAFLLNTWFPKGFTLFAKARAFIEKVHKRHWANDGPSFIRVTFKIGLMKCPNCKSNNLVQKNKGFRCFECGEVYKDGA